MQLCCLNQHADIQCELWCSVSREVARDIRTRSMNNNCHRVWPDFTELCEVKVVVFMVIDKEIGQFSTLTNAEELELNLTVNFSWSHRSTRGCETSPVISVSVHSGTEQCACGSTDKPTLWRRRESGTEIDNDRNKKEKISEEATSPEMGCDRPFTDKLWGNYIDLNIF